MNEHRHLHDEDHQHEHDAATERSVQAMNRRGALCVVVKTRFGGVAMRYALVVTCLTLLAEPALADPHKAESGKGRWGYERGERHFDYDRDRDRGRRAYGYDREYKQEFRRGNCKIERKWERDGSYKEEVKCKGGHRW